MNYYNYYYIGALILFGLSAVISLIVKTTFNKYLEVPARYNGLQAAEIILSENGLSNLQIGTSYGTLSDNFNPADQTVHLSYEVMNKASVASVAVAAHECGHALQNAEGYPLLTLRTSIVPVVNLASKASYFIILLGLIMNYYRLIAVGAVVFSIIVLFNLLTLPMEIDASNRGLAMIKEYGLLDEEQYSGGWKVLRAAGLTYFLALLSSLFTLMHYMQLAQSRRRR